MALFKPRTPVSLTSIAGTPPAIVMAVTVSKLPPMMPRGTVLLLISSRLLWTTPPLLKASGASLPAPLRAPVPMLWCVTWGAPHPVLM
ncbi:MAG: hypothetical protein ACFFDI_00595 [Promethearchaeota archaeon]